VKSIGLFCLASIGIGGFLNILLGSGTARVSVWVLGSRLQPPLSETAPKTLFSTRILGVLFGFATAVFLSFLLGHFISGHWGYKLALMAHFVLQTLFGYHMQHAPSAEEAIGEDFSRAMFEGYLCGSLVGVLVAWVSLPQA
jgi:hypothetical protein